MNTKSNKQYPIGFTAVDNRLFYMQDRLSPNAFSIFVRIYRMSDGYDSKPKSLSNTYFQTACNVSKNTVTRSVKELETLGVIKVQRRARANSLYSINMQTVDNLYKLAINDSHNDDSLKPSEVTTESSNRVATKQNPLKQNNTKENINIPFSDFWNKYDYAKGQKSPVEAKWLSLTDEERTLTMQSLDKYLLSTPDKTFRKYPMTYLNTEAWNDEVVLPTEQVSNNAVSQGYSASFKLFDTNTHNHTSTDNQTDLGSESISTGKGLDSIKDVLAQSSQVHWSELKAKGLLKKQVNPSVITVSESKQQEIDDFLARNSSKRFKRDVA